MMDKLTKVVISREQQEDASWKHARRYHQLNGDANSPVFVTAVQTIVIRQGGMCWDREAVTLVILAHTVPHAAVAGDVYTAAWDFFRWQTCPNDKERATLRPAWWRDE